MSTFKQDGLHSSVEFKIKHLMISNVRGRFNSFDAIIMSDSEDISHSKIFCEINVGSIDTGIKDRDNHLRSADFFDVEKYPTMNFASKDIIRTEMENVYEMTGSLRIKNVSRPVTLEMIYNGKDIDNYGQEKLGFDINGKIKRSDWNLDFNIPGGKNTLLIGDEVDIDISIQIIRAD